MEPTTGYLNLKKGEPMMNTFTYLLTYLFRCNTDVTSLLSGTAVKAVVAYISDYISKTPLKTYVVFDTIHCIFEKNSELIGGSQDRQEKARKIMTQIVNSLTSKLEIGAPLASLYLLQQPDHYTDHKFVPFYWLSYVHEARKVWHEEDAKAVEDNDLLLLKRSMNLLSGSSPVFDYIYRPSVCEHICLYDWICTYERVALSRKLQHKIRDSHTMPDMKSILSFEVEHPLYSTHGIQPLALGCKWVPNFIGPSLPHSNKGDREFYCATMLTLFAPWRTGYDLKPHNKTWDVAFIAFNFKQGHKIIMQNFNVKYECLDAHDDFSLQRRNNSHEQGFVPMSKLAILERLINEMEEDNGFEGDIDFEPMLTNFIGRKTAKWEYDKGVVEEIMTNSGWLKELPTSSVAPYITLPDRVQPAYSLDASKWRAKVNE